VLMPFVPLHAPAPAMPAAVEASVVKVSVHSF